MLRISRAAIAVLVLSLAALPCVAAQPVANGVVGSRDVEDVPLPASGFEVFIVGELHGLLQNEEIQLAYLKRLNREWGLRDVAIEEDSVYEAAAQAYVDGREGTIPAKLCLRAGMLAGIRQLNQALPAESHIRLHLVDIDSPVTAIRMHLLSVVAQMKATGVRVPEVGQLWQQGFRTIAQLYALQPDPFTTAALRTIEYSLIAWRDGLEADTGAAKGSPYLESREEAVTRNIADLIRVQKVPSLLVLYGADHASRTPRRDGGPKRDQNFKPMALRLQEGGIRAFSVVTFPLAGKAWWRGSENEFPWTAQDGKLESGEVLDEVLMAAPEAAFVYVDRTRHRVRLPSQDISNMAVDAFLLFRLGTPMANRCGGS